LNFHQPENNVFSFFRHYLGSNNHSLLTIEKLQEKKLRIGIIFSGDEHPTTESIILKKTGVTFLGRINEEQGFDKEMVRKYAAKFKHALESF
ncbi:MAG: AAA family ATPase, partial [Allomuricauda sp.]